MGWQAKSLTPRPGLLGAHISAHRAAQYTTESTSMPQTSVDNAQRFITPRRIGSIGSTMPVREFADPQHQVPTQEIVNSADVRPSAPADPQNTIRTQEALGA